MHWIVLWVRIVAAYAIARSVAAQGVVAGIASSKSMAAVSAVSAESPRYSDCGGLEGAVAAAPERSEAAELAAIAALLSELRTCCSDSTKFQFRNLIFRGCCDRTLSVSQGGNVTRYRVGYAVTRLKIGLWPGTLWPVCVEWTVSVAE